MPVSTTHFAVWLPTANAQNPTPCLSQRAWHTPKLDLAPSVMVHSQAKCNRRCARSGTREAFYFPVDSSVLRALLLVSEPTRGTTQMSRPNCEQQHTSKKPIVKHKVKQHKGQTKTLLDLIAVPLVLPQVGGKVMPTIVVFPISVDQLRLQVPRIL